MPPARTLTIANLYLAYRQAKTALYFERRGVGLLELAAFEQDLPDNLRNLQAKLSNQTWFDNIELGEAWIVPKRLRSTKSEDDTIRIGTPVSQSNGRPLEMQLRLAPHPAFAAVEVLYLWQFGGSLEKLLSNNVLGYRLDLRAGNIVPHRRWLFEYWPPQYQKFRTEPLTAARSALERREKVIVVSGDFASFYDTIASSFLLSDDFVSSLRAGNADVFDADVYRHATSSLLRAYARYRREASLRASTTIDIGVPIGALTSRVVANVALAPLDRYISMLPDVLCYRRYVDDFVIIAKADKCGTKLDVLRALIPMRPPTDDILLLDVDRLGRHGSEFQLQKEKIRVHHLTGVPGMDFVNAVATDFDRVVSERRAFVDSATLLGNGATHLVRAGEAEGSPLRVLRDADRTKLERFALSTSLHSLERISSLVDHDQARNFIRQNLEQIGRVLKSEDNWVDNLDLSLRLLKLAISTGDWQSAEELNDHMDLIWGNIDSLRAATTSLYYRGREISPRVSRPWTVLRNYLHERRLEAVCSALPLDMEVGQIESRFRGGVVTRTTRIGPVALRRRAELLASADLRARDREDDSRPKRYKSGIERKWLRRELSKDDSLMERLATIDNFVKRCELLGDRPWILPSARLFLCTRPPSYFDIASRWLSEVETDGFARNVFERLLAVVNAVRGTDYRDPVGSVVNSSTVSMTSFNPIKSTDEPSSTDPRIILGNLVVKEEYWHAAATRTHGSRFGDPELGLTRLKSLARILDKSTRVSRENPSTVLVLPELSVPRSWFRAVSNHVVRFSRFGLVVGLEYMHDISHHYVMNQVYAVLPGPFSSVATWPWTKRLPAREEDLELQKLPTPLAFPPPPTSRFPRTVVKSPWGTFSVLICSELIEARRVADLLGRVNVVLCPAWNLDTSSYDHLIQSVGFQLHSIIAIANNGHYSDCRTWAPHKDRWQRDLCRLIEREVDDIVHVDIPLTSLLAFHAGRPGEWRPLPPDWP
jgi:hypothetical protein